MMKQDPKKKITDIILKALESLRSILPSDVGDFNEESLLFGDRGVLDSVALVALVVAVEQEIIDSLGTVVVLADERAVSQTRSPFRSVGAFSDYIISALDEANPQWKNP